MGAAPPGPLIIRTLQFGCCAKGPKLDSTARAYCVRTACDCSNLYGFVQNRLKRRHNVFSYRPKVVWRRGGAAFPSPGQSWFSNMRPSVLIELILGYENRANLWVFWVIKTFGKHCHFYPDWPFFGWSASGVGRGGALGRAPPPPWLQKIMEKN